MATFLNAHFESSNDSRTTEVTIRNEPNNKESARIFKKKLED